MPAALRPVFILDASPAAALGIGATSNVDFTSTRGMVLVDAHTVATATNAGSTAQPQRQALGSGAFNAMTTAALALDTTSNLIRTSTIVAAQRLVAATDVIRSVFIDGGGGGGANGNLYSHFVVLPVTGA